MAAQGLIGALPGTPLTLHKPGAGTPSATAHRSTLPSKLASSFSSRQTAGFVTSKIFVPAASP